MLAYMLENGEMIALNPLNKKILKSVANEKISQLKNKSEQE